MTGVQTCALPILTAYDLFDKYGIENCVILLIENFPCETKDQLRAQEGHHIQTIKCINKLVAGRSRKQYNEANKDKIVEYSKQYYEANKDKIVEYSKQYNEANKDKKLEYIKQYRAENKEKIKQQKTQPYTCVCGACIRITEKARHERTQKHQNYQNNKYN